VPIYPTLEQINNAITTLPFSSINNPLNERCPIGLEYFQPNDVVSQIIRCGHIFCTHEIQSWFQNNVHCPVCRYDIRENTSVNNTSVNNTSVNNTSVNNDTSVNENNNNRTRNRLRNRLRSNNESNIINEVMNQFLTSYLESSNNVDLSNNRYHY
jgi:hypothetical protein